MILGSADLVVYGHMIRRCEGAVDDDLDPLLLCIQSAVRDARDRLSSLAPGPSSAQGQVVPADALDVTARYGGRSVPATGRVLSATYARPREELATPIDPTITGGMGVAPSTAGRCSRMQCPTRGRDSSTICATGKSPSRIHRRSISAGTERCPPEAAAGPQCPRSPGRSRALKPAPGRPLGARWA